MHIPRGTEVDRTLVNPDMPRQEPDVTERPHCPACGAVSATALWTGPAGVHLLCRVCGELWGVRERRRMRRKPNDPLKPFPREPETE